MSGLTVSVCSRSSGFGWVDESKSESAVTHGALFYRQQNCMSPWFWLVNCSLFMMLEIILHSLRQCHLTSLGCKQVLGNPWFKTQICWSSSSYWVEQQRLSTGYKEGNCQSNTGALRPCFDWWAPTIDLLITLYKSMGPTCNSLWWSVQNW